MKLTPTTRTAIAAIARGRAEGKIRKIDQGPKFSLMCGDLVIAQATNQVEFLELRATVGIAMKEAGIVWNIG